MDREAANTPRDALRRACSEELRLLEVAGLRRRTDDADPVVTAGLSDFTSNDYLGLARDPRVIESAVAATRADGAGARAARLLGGGATRQAALEAKLAQWQGTEAALLFPSGYQANLGVLTAFAGRGDAILSDELDHASIVDACRLSKARIEIFAHADLDSLAAALRRVRGARRRIVVTESVFSMDGDLAPLDAIHQLCLEHDALLLVDDAHAVGVLGDERAGAWRAGTRRDGSRDGRALLGRIITGGKALGAAGGIFLGDREVRETLLHRARSFVFSTALPPAVIGALDAAIDIVRADASLATRCQENARRFADVLELPPPAAAIVPIVMGDADAAVAAQQRCRAAGFDVRAVRPPTVPAGSSRLRVVAHAWHSREEIDRLCEVLAPLLAAARERAGSRAFARSTANAGRSVFVVGTDTGIGKTVVSALVVRALRSRGEVRYWKPVQTGDDSDTSTVRSLAECAPSEVLAPEYEFPLPASPHTAAAAAGRAISDHVLDDAHRRHVADLHSRAHLVIEFAGGLLVPYRIGFDQGDWLARRATRHDRIVLVARSGLGTLNHTRLTLEALARRGITPSLLVLVGEPHPANRATLHELEPDLPIVEVPFTASLSPAFLRDLLLAESRGASLADQIADALV